MKYIDRTIDLLLSEWRETAKRKPILLRGARQVGKTSYVRHLSESFEEYVEVNFELDIDVCRVFEIVRDPQEICRQISLLKNSVIEPGRTLLFLDEIQVCPAAIEALRFFYEKMPELHVIAAGSLLEFSLRDLPSFGVGRIRSIFMYPLTFNEFLHAQGEDILASAINEASKEKPLPDAVHKKTLGLLSVFTAIGGMPESVATYCETKRITACHAVLDDILVSLYGDFSKYHTRMDVSRIRSVFASIIRQTGGKFVFAHASEGANSAQVRECLSLLTLAGLVFPVTHTSAQGLPLAAETNQKFQKYLIFDTGIYLRFLRTDLATVVGPTSVDVMNRGALAELLAGLELVKAFEPSYPAELYYWQREKRGAQAEVDYVVQKGGDIVAIEVKSGVKGSMRSLDVFMGEHPHAKGMRTSAENFGQVGNVDIAPIYALGQIWCDGNAAD